MNIIHRHHSNRNVLTRTSAKSHEIVLQGHTSTNWSQSWVFITFVLLLSKYKEWEWKKEHMNESERIILCICFRWILQICYSHALTCNHKWASHVCRWKLLKVKGILNSRCNFQTPPWKLHKNYSTQLRIWIFKCLLTQVAAVKTQNQSTATIHMNELLEHKGFSSHHLLSTTCTTVTWKCSSGEVWPLKRPLLTFLKVAVSSNKTNK